MSHKPRVDPSCCKISNENAFLNSDLKQTKKNKYLTDLLTDQVAD